MNLVSFPSEHPDCRITILEVVVNTAKKDDDPHVTVRFEVRNDTDTDWEYLDVRTQLLSATGQLLAEAHFPSREQTIKSGAIVEFETTFWAIGDRMLGDNPEQASVSVSALACMHKQQKPGETCPPEELLDVLTLELVKAINVSQLVCVSSKEKRADLPFRRDGSDDANTSVKYAAEFFTWIEWGSCDDEPDDLQLPRELIEAKKIWSEQRLNDEVESDEWHKAFALVAPFVRCCFIKESIRSGLSDLFECEAEVAAGKVSVYGLEFFSWPLPCLRASAHFVVPTTRILTNEIYQQWRIKYDDWLSSGISFYWDLTGDDMGFNPGLNTHRGLGLILSCTERCSIKPNAMECVEAAA